MDHSKDFTNNDVYFMEVVSDRIIINDDYDGVLILDSELNVIKRIKLLDNLIIDMSFIKDKEIVLYCYENQCLIHINIESYAYNIISLNNDLKDKIFLSMYEWVDSDLLLLSDNGALFINMNLLDNTAKVISKDILDKLNFSIYDNWNKLSKFLIHKVYPDRYDAVIESNNVIKLINYKNDTQCILKIEPIKFHDIEVISNCVVQISEKKISILYNGKNVMLYPNPKHYSFLKAKFITIDKTVYLLLLVGSNSDSTISKIEKYPLEELLH